MTTRTYNYLDADPMVYFRTGSTPSLSILYVCIHLYYTILSRHTIYIYTYIRSLISFCTGWFICSISTYIRNYAYKNPLTHTYIYICTHTHMYTYTQTRHILIRTRINLSASLASRPRPGKARKVAGSTRASCFVCASFFGYLHKVLSRVVLEIFYVLIMLGFKVQGAV